MFLFGFVFLVACCRDLAGFFASDCLVLSLICLPTSPPNCLSRWRSGVHLCLRLKFHLSCNDFRLSLSLSSFSYALSLSLFGNSWVGSFHFGGHLSSAKPNDSTEHLPNGLTGLRLPLRFSIDPRYPYACAAVAAMIGSLVLLSLGRSFRSWAAVHVLLWHDSGNIFWTLDKSW